MGLIVSIITVFLFNLFYHKYFFRTRKLFLKEARNSLIIRPLDFQIKKIAQLRIMFCKIPMNTHATICVMLVCQFFYAEVLFDFEG